MSTLNPPAGFNALVLHLSVALILELYVNFGLCRLACLQWFVQVGLAAMVFTGWPGCNGLCRLARLQWFVQVGLAAMVCAGWPGCNGLCRMTWLQWFVCRLA
jgi:hypothetical protein